MTAPRMFSARPLEDKLIGHMDQNQETFSRYMNDKDFQQLVSESLRKQVYGQVRIQQPSES
jgi:hypothetical protein